MHSRRLVAAIVATLLACLAVSGTAARAITSDTGDVELTATGAPDVLRGTGDEQAAGDLRFASSDGSELELVNTERIIIEVSDGLDQNCDAAGKSIGFHALPNVTLTSGEAEVSWTLASSTTTNKLRSTSTSCAAFVPLTKDQLILTVTTPVGGGHLGAINISDISYDVGALAAVGEVHLNWAADVPTTDPTMTPGGTGDSAPQAAPADGYITNLGVSSNRGGPLSLGSGKSFGTLTFAETDAAATTPADTGNGVCVNLVAPFRMVFVDAGSVNVSAGTDTAATPELLNSGHTVRFGTTSSNKSTYVLSGVKADVSQLGPQAADVTQCDATGAPQPITPAAESDDAVTYTASIRPPASPANASERFPGENRNDTAAQIAVATFGCNPDADPVFALVARNDSFADALAANYVAGQLGAPVLLVAPTGPLPDETVGALHDLATTDVIVMGGSAAVGDDVFDELAALTSFDCSGAERTTLIPIIPRTLTVTRIQGDTRFGTARAAGGSTRNGHTIGTLDADMSDGQAESFLTAILVNGRNFPDAVVAGAMSYQGSTCERSTAGTNCEGFPLIESDGPATTLPADTDGFLTDHAIKQVIIVGGVAAVPQEIEDAIIAKGIKVIRLAGGTRQGTATAVASFEYDALQFGVAVNPFGNPLPVGTVALARGDFFADALALGPLAGAGFEPILLTVDPSTVGTITDDYLGIIGGPFTGNGPGFAVSTIHLGGGTAAISDDAKDEALDALG